MTFDTAVPLDPPAEALHQPPATPAADSVTAPRIRWAGIIWGAVFAAAAASALWFLSGTARRDAVHDWLLTLSPEALNPGAVVGVAILAVGLLLVIVGGVALLRRAQLRSTIGP